MYNTFRIKPYLVQIHENIVLFLFKPSDVFAKHYHTYGSPVVWEKSLPIQVKKISTAPFFNEIYTHESFKTSHIQVSLCIYTLKKMFFSSLLPFQALWTCGQLKDEGVLAALLQENLTRKEIFRVVKDRGLKSFFFFFKFLVQALSSIHPFSLNCCCF